MDAWKEKISNCHCWYPSITVNFVANLLDASDDLQELVDIGSELVENNMTHQFEKWKEACNVPQNAPTQTTKLHAIEKIFEIADKFNYTQAMHQDIQKHLHHAETCAHSLALEQKMVSTRVVQKNCTCKRKDPGLIRTQGHPDTVEWNEYPEVWKPYTTSYPLKNIDDSGLILDLKTPDNIVEKYFHTASQMNARTTWINLGEHKYVDFSDGSYTTHARKTPKRYNTDFIDFNNSTHDRIVLYPNGFGEHFEFYNDQGENLKYLSKTEVGDYVNIDKYSHTDQFRSDCSLWYRYHQERIKANILKHATPENWKHLVENTKWKIKKLQLDPPRTHEERYKYWKYIKNIL
jgi:hypothetical protein